MDGLELIGSDDDEDDDDGRTYECWSEEETCGFAVEAREREMREREAGVRRFD